MSGAPQHRRTMMSQTLLALSVPAPPVAADAPVAGLAALSNHSPGAGEGCSTGGAELTLGLAHRSASASMDAGGGATSTSASPAEMLDDDGVPLSAEAAASPFSPPATQRHAAFLKLVDLKVKAGLQCRHMRDADFSALAAEAGVPLFGDESIIVARLRANQSTALSNQACEEEKRGPAGEAEAKALLRRAWVVLLAQALPVIQARKDKGTLLPGTLRKVEEAYHVYEQEAIARVTEKPAPETAEILHFSRTCGYETALSAALAALALLMMPAWRAAQRERAQAFVLAVLRLIPQTSGVTDTMASENELVDFIERYMTPSNYGADLCSSVLAVWRSPAVVNVLRSRGALQDGITVMAAFTAEFEARNQADLAKRGLRRCGLPSCGRLETTVLQFRVCGHCQTTRYCCPEHAKLHWRAHKREYEEGEGGEASGEGGAASATERVGPATR